jgi:RNA-directed DNA polymerase
MKNNDLNFLETINTLSGFLNHTGYSHEALINLLNFNEDFERYKLFKMPKKNGGVRVIQCPDVELMQIQRVLNHGLIHAYMTYAPTSAHGFTLKRSIVTNAKNHANQAWVLNFDLLDFFHSFDKEDVKTLFLSPPFECDNNVADILTKLCTTQRGLPQGAPTSPTLSNWLTINLDDRMMQFAAKHNLRYSRYADDITLSSSEAIPLEIAIKDQRSWLLGDELVSIVEDCGFKVNPRKTRLQTQHNRQVVTGLTVNSCVNVNRTFVRNLRGMIHALEKHGDAAATHYLKHYRNNKDKLISKPMDHFLSSLNARLGFLSMVKGKDNPIVVKLKADLEKACELHSI